jgi:hypothetical protein
MPDFNPWLVGIVPGTLEILPSSGGADVFVDVRNQNPPIDGVLHNSALELKVEANGSMTYPDDEEVYLAPGERKTYVLQIPDVGVGDELCVSPLTIWKRLPDTFTPNPEFDGYDKPPDYVEQICGTIQPQSNSISVSACDSEPQTLTFGDPLTVSATVTNTATVSQTVELRFTAFGKTNTQTVTVPAQSNQNTSTTITAPEFPRDQEDLPVSVAYSIV